MNGVLYKRSISNKKQKEKNVIWKKLKKVLPYIGVVLVIYTVVFFSTLRKGDFGLIENR